MATGRSRHLPLPVNLFRASGASSDHMPNQKIIDGVDYSDRDDSLDVDGYYKVPRTFAELALERESVRKYLDSVGLKDKRITCDHCTRAFKCAWAFDLYNTNGECLDDK